MWHAPNHGVLAVDHGTFLYGCSQPVVCLIMAFLPVVTAQRCAHSNMRNDACPWRGNLDVCSSSPWYLVVYGSLSRGVRENWALFALFSPGNLDIISAFHSPEEHAKLHLLGDGFGHVSIFWQLVRQRIQFTRQSRSLQDPEYVHSLVSPTRCHTSDSPSHTGAVPWGHVHRDMALTIGCMRAAAWMNTS